MKNDHLSNLILVIVILVALAGLFFLYRGTGRAIAQTPIKVESLGFCCCSEENSLFVIPAPKIAIDLTSNDCSALCSERSTPFHPVFSKGPC